MLLGDEPAPPVRCGDLGLGEDPGEVEAARLPVVERGTHLEAIRPADHLVDRPEAQAGHVLAHLLGDEAHEVDDVLGVAREPLAQLRVLGRDAHRAGVEVARPHDDAAERDERRRREAELLRAEQRADDDVAARLELAVHLHGDPAAQVVHHEDLVGLGEAQLPGRARVLDRGER